MMTEGTILKAIDEIAAETSLSQYQIYHDHQLVQMAIELCKPLTTHSEAKLLLKGGTALAKQGIAMRFSEDIDLGIVPPSHESFGNKKRHRCMQEIRIRAQAFWSKKLDGRSGKWYSRYEIPYPPLEQQYPSKRQRPVVKVEATVNTGIGRYETTELLSLVDEHLEMDTKQELIPQVTCCHPLETLGEKLHALNRIIAHEPPEKIISRVRDIYDIACILRSYGHELVPGDITSFYEAANRPEGDRFRLSRLTPIPPDGLRSLDIWYPHTERHNLLSQAYEQRIVQLIYGEEMSFKDCMYAIQAHMHLL